MGSFFKDIIINIIAGIIGSAILSIIVKKRFKISKPILILFFFSALSFLIPISSLGLQLWFNKEVPLLINFLIFSISLLAGFISGFFAFKKYIMEMKAKSTIEDDGWEKELAIFREKTNEYCDSNFRDALCSIKGAFHEIEIIFNTYFKRGICIDDAYKREINIDKTDPSKKTTFLEYEIRKIYIKYIDKTVFKKNISLDIDIYGEDDNLKESTINHRWILDTIDGGIHFTRNIPLFTSTIALQIKENNEWVTKLGAIYVPTTREMFFSLKGKGAYLNNWECKLPLNRKSSLEDSIFYIEFPNKHTMENRTNGKYKKACELISNIFINVKKVRGFNVGSFGLAYVAKGSFDAYISLAGYTSCHDSEAGKLLVEESELKTVTGSKGKVIKEPIILKGDFDLGSRIFASSEKIYQELKKNEKLAPLFKELFSEF